MPSQPTDASLSGMQGPGMQASTPTSENQQDFAGLHQQDASAVDASSEQFGAGYAPAPDSWHAPGHTTQNTFDTGHPLGYLPDGRRSGPKRIIAIIALVVMAMVVLGAAIVAMLTGGGSIIGVGKQTASPTASASSSSTQGSQGEDPIAVPPPAVDQLVARVNGEDIQWSWTDPAVGTTSAGHRRYVYTVSKPGADDAVAETRQNAVSVKAVPGEVCIEVVSVAENGRASQPTKNCVTIPEKGNGQNHEGDKNQQGNGQQGNGQQGNGQNPQGDANTNKEQH